MEERAYFRLSPTMDRFLGLQFFGPFLVCLAAFTAAYLVGDVSERFDDLVDYGGLGLLGLEFFALRIPLMISQLLPAATLAGVLLAFAMMNRSGEVLACQQLGMSRLQMAVPVLVMGAAISVFNFGLSETVVPIATREAHYLYRVEMKRRNLPGVFSNQHIWVRLHDGFLAADRYDANRQTLQGVTLYRLGPDYGLLDIVRAATATWDGHRWTVHGSTTIQLGPTVTVAATGAHNFGKEVPPADLSLLRLDSEEFSLVELNRYISQLRREGLSPGGYVVDRDLKFAMPVSCLIMVALGVALSLDPLPRNSRLGRSLGLAILFGGLYWVVLGIASSLGRSEAIPAWTAAWMPNAMFGVVAVSIFLFGEER